MMQIMRTALISSTSIAGRDSDIGHNNKSTFYSHQICRKKINFPFCEYVKDIIKMHMTCHFKNVLMNR